MIDDLTPEDGRSPPPRRPQLTAARRGPAVVDIDVFSARLIPDSPLARQYEPLLVGRIELVSFQTVAEVRYGAQLQRLGQRSARPHGN